MSSSGDRKRPWGDTTLAGHWSAGAELTGLEASTILDVGFGRLRRSTRALGKVFPSARIVAIDNDVALINELADSGWHSEDRLRFLFGDADAWLPRDKFDLIAICMSTHAFSHPARAIANLVENNLKPDGHVLFVHRTDAVMRATVRLPIAPGEETVETNTLQRLWAQVTNKLLPWNVRLVCEHDLVAYFCRCLGLNAVASWTSDHGRESNETYRDIFGTHEGEPQYEAPRWVWQQPRTVWPSPKDEVLSSKVRLETVLYRYPERALSHVVPFVDNSRSPGLLDLGIGSDATPDSREFRTKIHQLVKRLLGTTATELIGCYYIDERQPITVWGPPPTLTGAEPPVTFTRAIAASNLCPGKSDNPPLLVALFPGVSDASAIDETMASPDRYRASISNPDVQVVLVPLVENKPALSGLLGGLSDASGEVAGYLVARGGWAREMAGKGASLYVFLFQSPILDPSGHLEAVTFLSSRWLEPESVRILVEVAHAMLSHFEERNAAAHSERAKLAENLRAELDRILLGRSFIETLRDATTKLVEIVDPLFVATESLSRAAAIAREQFPVGGAHEVKDHGTGIEACNMVRRLVVELDDVAARSAATDLSRAVVQKVAASLKAALDSGDVLGALILAKALSHSTVTCTLLGCRCSKHVELRPDTADDTADHERFLKEFVTIAGSWENVRVCANHTLKVSSIENWETVKREIRKWWIGSRPTGKERGATSWQLALLLRGRRGKVDEVALDVCKWNDSTKELSASLNTRTLYTGIE